MINVLDMLGCSEDAAALHRSGGTDCSQPRQVESARAQCHPSDRLESCTCTQCYYIDGRRGSLLHRVQGEL